MVYIDQMMREIRLEKPPSRIVSLVPSVTELLFDLGLENEICGITKFCIHPEQIYRSKKRIGGTKKVDHKIIAEINPDLIFGNKEENTKEDIELLEKLYPVWMSDITTLDDAYSMIEQTGIVTGRESEAKNLNQQIKSEFTNITPAGGLNTLYLIWKNPYMAAGGDTFINDMLVRCGLNNVLANSLRYPEVDAEAIKKLAPEIILLSSEPFPFSEKHITELQEIVPGSKILLADGEYFSWYGSRMKGAPGYFNELIRNLNRSVRTDIKYEN